MSEPTRPTRRPTLTRRRAIALIAVAIGGTLVIEADAVVRRVAVQRAHEVLADCVEMTGLEVDLGSFPVARALRGRLDGIGVQARTVTIADVRLRGLRGEVDRVRFSLSDGFDGAEVEHGQISIALGQGDLTRLLHELEVPGSAEMEGDGVRIRLDGVAEPIALDIHAEAGDAVIALTGALAPLLHLRLDLPGVRVTQIAPAPGSLVVNATITGSPRDLACTAARTLEEHFTGFERLAALVPT